jgi:RluA family pseudouridine synthase
MKHDPINKEITLTAFISNKSSQTLIEFLVSRFKYLSEEEWKGRVQEGKVKVNGREASLGQPLRAGDEVAYTTNAWEEPEVNKNYRIVYEDEHLMAVSKPAPLPVHAIGAYFRNSLTHLLRTDRPEAENYHLAHRLDSETSGLILIAKDTPTLKKIQKDWNDNIQKTYRAIVFGVFPPGATRCDGPIGPKKGSEVRMKLAVVPKKNVNKTTAYCERSVAIPVEGGKESLTLFKGLESRGKFSLVEAQPLTGRTHQIRVHLEHLGFPIVGDKLYSGDDETFLHFYEYDWDPWLEERVLLKRTALHAFRVEFTHPQTGKRITLEDPLPEDMAKFWESLVPNP